MPVTSRWREANLYLAGIGPYPIPDLFLGIVLPESVLLRRAYSQQYAQILEPGYGAYERVPLDRSLWTVDLAATPGPAILVARYPAVELPTPWKAVPGGSTRSTPYPLRLGLFDAAEVGSGSLLALLGYPAYTPGQRSHEYPCPQLELSLAVPLLDLDGQAFTGRPVVPSATCAIAQGWLHVLGIRAATDTLGLVGRMMGIRGPGQPLETASSAVDLRASFAWFDQEAVIGAYAGEPVTAWAGWFDQVARSPVLERLPGFGATAVSRVRVGPSADDADGRWFDWLLQPDSYVGQLHWMPYRRYSFTSPDPAHPGTWTHHTSARFCLWAAAV